MKKNFKHLDDFKTFEAKVNLLGLSKTEIENITVKRDRLYISLKINKEDIIDDDGNVIEIDNMPDIKISLSGIDNIDEFKRLEGKKIINVDVDVADMKEIDLEKIDDMGAFDKKMFQLNLNSIEVTYFDDDEEITIDFEGKMTGRIINYIELLNFYKKYANTDRFKKLSIGDFFKKIMFKISDLFVNKNF